ncbi:MAG TPA: TIR domain-containing protein [Candidatus Methylomirabilis sp.]|nr:TIR domain-containing protein [Candidatus Methylomirabilis sp.]
MPNIFLSYNRQSEAIARTLAEDIEALGHTVWFDQELRGGQVWWDQILARVRTCDVFVFLLDPKALESTACKREYSYAADLGRPILPILVAEGVSTNLLPPALSQIQFVDYRKQDRNALRRLVKALTTLPPAKPLPDPLPHPPEVPISYLGGLAEQIEATASLDYEKQSAMVVDLKRSLRDPETFDDAHALLVRLRNRRDLLATIADEIDEVLQNVRNAKTTPPRAPEPALRLQEPSPEPRRIQPPQGNTESLQPERKALQEEALVESPPEAAKIPSGPRELRRPATAPPAPSDASRPPTPRERKIVALIGALVGVAVGFAPQFYWATGAHRLAWDFLPGVGGAIAGAINGIDRRGILGVLFCAAFAGFFVAVLWPEPRSVIFQEFSPIYAGVVFGVPLGAIIGAIAGRFSRNREGSS